MRILFDLSRLTAGGAGGGIKQTLFGLLRWWREGAHGQGTDLLLVTNAETRDELHPFIRPGDQVVDAGAASPESAAEFHCNLVYCAFGTTDFACPGIPTVVLVVDLLHRDFPDSVPGPDRSFREQQLQSSLGIADCFHVISDFTSARMQQTYGVAPEKIVRTYLPLQGRLPFADAPAAPAAPSHTPYFLYPANTWIHKNHEALLAAYAAYCRHTGTDRWSLVLTGHVHDSRAGVLHDLTRSLGIEDRVLWAGFVDEPELASLYAEAGALVFPSLYEGFGLPLLEAMAAGVPILASNAACIPEIVGNAALLIDARKPAELASGLARMASDRELRARLIRNGHDRLTSFDQNREFDRLRQTFLTVANAPARWRRAGYHPADGLIDPLARFALPPSQGELRLSLDLRPLPAPRTVQLRCGATLLTEATVDANRPRPIRCSFRPTGRLLTIQVPDATPLCATDPRTHGVLIAALSVESADGARFDLLSDGPPASSPAPDRLAPADSGPTPRESAEALQSGTPHTPTLQSSPEVGPRLESFVEQPASWNLHSRSATIRGWCFASAGAPVEAVRLRLSNLTFFAEFGLARPDVQSAFPNAPGPHVGFEFRPLLPAGTHQLHLEAGLADGTWHAILTRPVTVKGRIVPLWIGAGSWSELMSHQMPAQMVHPPRPLQPESFPRPTSSPHGLKFGIVTPSFQQGAFIEATIRSVLEQPGVTVVYRVQDGGSTDGSVTTIQRHASRLAGWESAPDNGQADALAKGLGAVATQLAPTDLMAWINSDDLYTAGALRFVAEYFAHHQEVDAVYGHRILIDHAGDEIARWFLPPHDDEVLRFNDFVPQETLFWRRRIWDQVGGIDSSLRFAMDWDLLLRFHAAGAKIVRLPFFLGCFRVHARQKTSAQISTVGQSEIDRLRERTFGRKIAPAELENSPRLHRYLRKSAWLQFLWRYGIRGR